MGEVPDVPEMGESSIRSKRQTSAKATHVSYPVRGRRTFRCDDDSQIITPGPGRPRQSTDITKDLLFEVVNLISPSLVMKYFDTMV